MYFFFYRISFGWALLRWPRLALVRPSVCLFRRHTHCDSPGGSMRRGQRTFRPDDKEDRDTFLMLRAAAGDPKLRFTEPPNSV